MQILQRGACSFDAKRLWSASPDGLLPLCGSKIHLRFQIAHEFYIRLCIAARTGRAARRVTTFECKNRQGARRVVRTGPPACGWLRGTSRTSPGPPRRWRGPGRLRSTSARGRGFAAYLSACGGQPLHRPRLRATPGGASLTAFGFVALAPRCFAGAKQFPHIRSRRLPRLGTQDKWSWRPTFVCICQSPRDPGGLEREFGGGTLPPLPPA